MRVGDVDVVIQAEATLRDQIAASVHRISGEDRNHCPLKHAIGLNPAYRPTMWDPATVGDAEAVSVCRYVIAARGGAGPDGSALFSSLLLDGTAARDAVAAILAAPEGGGPNRTDPKKCDLNYGWGGEAYVVRIARDRQDPAEIVVHYSGCTNNGFYDGRTIRTLTAEGLARLVAQPNRPSGYIGDKGMPGLMARARQLSENG